MRRAFSLIEVVLAMGMLAVIGAGIASAMFVAARALPRPGDPQDSQMTARRAADLVASDLALATSFSLVSPTAVEFSVPDRDADSKPETIRYEWSGKPGDPLYQTVNGVRSSLLAAPTTFDVSLDTFAAQRTSAGANAEGPETLALSWNQATDKTTAVTSTSRPAMQVFPVLPSDAVSWRITRVDFMASRSSTSTGTAVFNVDIRSGAGNAPALLNLESCPVRESAVPVSPGFVTATFSSNHAFSPSDAAWVLFSYSSGTSTTKISYKSSQAPDARLAYAFSNNILPTWTYTLDGAIPCAVYIRVTRPASTKATPLIASRARVRVATRADSPASAADARLLQAPQVSP